MAGLWALPASLEALSHSQTLTLSLSCSMGLDFWLGLDWGLTFGCCIRGGCLFPVKSRETNQGHFFQTNKLVCEYYNIVTLGSYFPNKLNQIH